MQKCTQCGRVGDDVGNCGSHLTCPKPNFQEVDPARDVVLECLDCDRRVTLTAGQIMHGATQTVIICPSAKEVCKARVVDLSAELANLPAGKKAKRAKKDS